MTVFEKYDQQALYKVDLPEGQRRLKEAILYVSERCAEFRYFGLIKLNKTLWRADFRSFYERGQPVTGRQYQRLENGPAPVEMPPLLRELASEGNLIFIVNKMGRFSEKRPVAKGRPVLNFFSREDLDYLDESISHYRDMTGTESSDQSHGIAWKTRKDGEPIPYQAAYFSDEPLSEKKLSKLSEIGRTSEWYSE
ncbi:Panacea domain-containing protein [Methyloligella sp. 2.7D]|uniref:Panacea domain-containing protein n=1 Tax=unclassified Methyloligella TaxID=2625955 RepID=UPI00157E058A|nr:Panacea domain-containing protein [Methyloligella sp. GL2]QKP76297.1 SocA family protein [Methyloligella sp. GL2]